MTTPIYPFLSGITVFLSTFETSVPGSIRSSLVSTPSVLSPNGSSSCASLIASLFARSVFAPVTASIIALGLDMYLRDMSRICSSMSTGWSPTATLAIPGRSTTVSARTWGGVYFEVYGGGVYAFVLPGESVGVADYFGADCGEVVEASAGEVEEFSPFLGLGVYVYRWLLLIVAVRGFRWIGDV